MRRATLATAGFVAFGAGLFAWFTRDSAAGWVVAGAIAATNAGTVLIGEVSSRRDRRRVIPAAPEGAL